MTRLATFFAIVFLAFTAGAADISMDIQPRAIQLGEAAQLTITMSGRAQSAPPQLPGIPDFQILSGGTQTSMQIINGVQSASVSYTYQLLPTKTGHFTIGPFNYNDGGQSVQLPAIEIDVVSGTGGSGALSDQLFGRLEASSTNLFHQQSFDLTFLVYSRGVNLDRSLRVDNMPTTGLKVQELRELGSGREVVNNQLYDVRRYRCRVTALTSGRFTLAPTLRLGLVTQRQRQDDFFAAFFGNGMESRPYDLATEPLLLNIKPLPENGRPAGYSGAVGKFAFDARISPTEVNAGEPVTLTTTLNGEGNLEVVGAPSVAAASDFRTYEPKMTVNEIDPERGIGRRIFEQVLIPKTDKASQLPAITFSYFDPEAGEYRTQTRGPFQMVVHASSNEAAQVVQGSAVRPEPSRVILGTDIGYLKPAPSRWRHLSETAWFQSPVFYGLQALPALALVAVFFRVRRRDELARDVSKARRQQAPKAARAALARAEKSLKEKQRRPFFEHLWEALAAYFGNRFNLSPGEVDRDVVLRHFADSAGDEVKQEIRDVFDACERERFGAGAAADAGQDEAFLERVRKLLNRCEGMRK